MNIFITGASGFIGSHFVKKLKKEHRLVLLSHNEVGGVWINETLSGTTIIKGDIRNLSLLRKIIARYDINAVCHFAGITKVKPAYLDPLSVYDINIMGSVALLEACRQLDVERILMMNTDKVYGEKLDATVDTPYQPGEPYATSKTCLGFIVKSYIETYGMNIVMPHSCNAFGYDPYSSRIFPNTIKACIKGEQPLIFNNDQSIREYIYIDDLTDAIETLFLNEKFGSGSYNVATGLVFNQREIVIKILELFPDLTAKYIHMALPSQIQEETMKMTRWRWKPKWDFNEAIEETVINFKEYEQDWRKIF